MKSIKVSIVSSSEEIYSGEATMVFATGTLGELGIAPGHTPLLTGLAPGPVRVQDGNDEKTFFCSGGFIEVQPDIVTFLSDTAERADSLDEAEAIKAKEAPPGEVPNSPPLFHRARACGIGRRLPGIAGQSVQTPALRVPICYSSNV